MGVRKDFVSRLIACCSLGRGPGTHVDTVFLLHLAARSRDKTGRECGAPSPSLAILVRLLLPHRGCGEQGFFGCLRCLKKKWGTVRVNRVVSSSPCPSFVRLCGTGTHTVLVLCCFLGCRRARETASTAEQREGRGEGLRISSKASGGFIV